MHPYTFHRLKNALWPEWMANSLLSSFRRIRDTIRDEVTNAADAEPEDSDDTQSSTLSVTIPHPFYTGKVTFEETMGNFRNTLRKTWKAPPPQKGFVRVEGVIQITSEKLLVHVDVDATFNPETMKDFRFKTLKVRYVARMPEKPQSPMFKARNPKRPPPAAIEASPKAEAGDLLEGSKVAGSKIQLKETRDVANTTQNVTISSQLATQASTANTQKKSASTVVETSKSPKKRTIDSDIFEDEAATATKKPNTVTITPLPPAKQAQADNNPRKEQ